MVLLLASHLMQRRKQLQYYGESWDFSFGIEAMLNTTIFVTMTIFIHSVVIKH